MEDNKMKVKIMQRSVYHKYAEVEVEVPDGMECNDIHEWLHKNENLWCEELATKLSESEYDFGFGMDTGDWTDRTEESEWRFEYGDKYGGHL